MAILDGLRNGYPQYFMVQPSQGLNPNILMGAAQMMRATRSGVPTSTAEKKPGSPEKVPQMIKATADKYIDLISATEAKKQAIISKAQSDTMNQKDDYETAKTYSAGMAEVIQEEANNKKFANQATIQYDQYKSISGLVEEKGIGGGIALVGGQPIGVDQKGNIIRETMTPGLGFKPEISHFMTNDEYLNRFNATGSWDEKINPVNMDVPFVYDPKVAYKDTYTRLVEAASTFNSTSNEKNFKSATGNSKSDGTFDIAGSLKSNYNQVLETIANDPQVILGGQQTYMSVLTDFAHASETGLTVAVKNPLYVKGSSKDKEKDQFVAKRANEVTLPEFIADRALNVGSPLLSKQTTDKTNTVVGGGSKEDMIGMNIEDIYNLNQTYQKLLETKGAIASTMVIPDTGGKLLKEDDKVTDMKAYPIISIPASQQPPGYIKSRNDAFGIRESELGISSYPLAKDFFKGGVFTEAGVVMDLTDMSDVKILSYVGPATTPAFETDPANGMMKQSLVYLRDEKGAKQTVTRKNPDGTIEILDNVLYTPGDKVEIAVLGSDLGKYGIVPVVDEKAAKELADKLNMPKDITKFESDARFYANQVTKWTEIRDNLKGGKGTATWNRWNKNIQDAEASRVENDVKVNNWIRDNNIPQETALQWKAVTAKKGIDQYSKSFREVTFDKKGKRVDGPAVTSLDKNKYYAIEVYAPRGASSGIGGGTTPDNAKKWEQLMQNDAEGFSSLDKMPGFTDNRKLFESSGTVIK
jgi:hypothetical protein